MILPIQSDGRESQYTGRNSDVSYEIVDSAIDLSKDPIVISHVDIVETSIEDGEEEIGDAEIDQKVVGRCPHAFVTYIKIELSQTAWKFQDFCVIQILREINFGESRSSKTAVLSF